MTSSTTMTSVKKSSSGGLFKLFSKSSSNEAKLAETDPATWTSDENSPSTGLRGLGLAVSTCNYIRPRVGMKLEPRSEQPCVRRPLLTNTCNSNVSPTATTRSRGETRQIQQVRTPTENQCEDQNLDQNVSPPSTQKLYLNSPGFASLKVHDVVRNITTDHERAFLWTKWLESYSKGEFNVRNPPQPPGLIEGITYLPAVYPKSEESRCALTNKYQLIWREWIRERAGVYIRGAMKRLGTQYGSMSFFDSRYELLKAENGYNMPQLLRYNSIAAHALYSTEVLSIVDTEKDWRFKNNPLVTGDQRIRFFAAAPIVNDNGDIIGVLSAFSDQPREVFSYRDSQEFAAISASLMIDMDAQLEYLYNPKPRPSPEIQGSTPADGETVCITSSSSSRQDYPVNDISRLQDGSVMSLYPEIGQYIPSVTGYRKHDLSSKAPPRISTNKTTQSLCLNPAEHTPPPSAECILGFSFDSPSVFSTREDGNYGTTSDANISAEDVTSEVKFLTKRPQGRVPTLELREIPSYSDLSDSPELLSPRQIPQASREPGLASVMKPYSKDPDNVSLLEVPKTESSLLFSNLQDSIIRESCIPDVSPRHFSSSNLMSINPPPPKTPNRSLLEEDCSANLPMEMSIQDFLALSDDDCTEGSDAIPPGIFAMNSKEITPVLSQAPSHGGFNFLNTNRPRTALEQGQNHTKNEALRFCNEDKLFSPVPITPTALPESLLTWKFPSPPRKSPVSTLGIKASNSIPDIGPTDTCTPPATPIFNFSNPSRRPSYAQNLQENDHPSSQPPSNRESRSGSQIFSACSSRCPSQAESITSRSLSCLAPRKRPSKEQIGQAARALAAHANKMGYALMYIAKVYPRSNDAPMITEADIKAPKPNGLKVQLLTAHGLADAIHLCPLIHLRVLRSRGATSWEDYGLENHLQQGTLMTIKSEGGNIKTRSKGLILGAFRATTSGQPRVETCEEIQALAELVETLKGILLTRNKSSTRLNTMTSSTSSHAWPANEAIEVGDSWKMSLDSFGTD